MDSSELLPLLPDLRTAAELFPGSRAVIRNEDCCFRSVRLYSGQAELLPDRLYIIRRGDDFPRDRFPWISPDDLTGEADHVIIPGIPPDTMLDTLLNLFARLRDQEYRLNSLLYRGAGLQELCEVGAELVENPIYIHDDWFIMIARSSQVDQVLSPEYVMSSERGFLPRAIIDDFRDDSDYLETYTHRSAQLWSAGKGVPTCLYVNLWDGSVYRGRLLIVESNRALCHEDFRLAEALTQRALFLLRRKQLGEHQDSRSMDDIIFALLQGQKPEPSDLTQLMNLLNWNPSDRLLCIRLQNQRPETTAIMEHALHSDLFRSFPNGYILLAGNQQCVLLNLNRSAVPLTELRHTLSLLCLEYCLYAGISSPVEGVRDLSLSYYQAGAALNQAFIQRNEKWVLTFADCTLNHILDHLDSPLQPMHLVSPELLLLMEHDRQKDTLYYDTLRQYLLCERDIPRTSEALIIHRTTLLYRLKKIRSLISADLDDPWQRLRLILSLWILDNQNPSHAGKSAAKQGKLSPD